MSTSVFEPTRKLLQVYFATGWAATTTPPPVKYPNVAFTQPKNSPWVAFNLSWGISRQAAIGPVGRRLERQAGVVIVQVFTPKNANEKTSLDYCDAVARILRMRQLSDSTAGIQVDLREASIPSAMEEKDYWMRNVSVVFQVDALF